MAFITLMGIVSLFSDMTHEGARSVLGEYLNLAGASAATIGFVSGVGELCGYSLRLLSGFLADKTKKYWTLVIVGWHTVLINVLQGFDNALLFYFRNSHVVPPQCFL